MTDEKFNEFLEAAMEFNMSELSKIEIVCVQAVKQYDELDSANHCLAELLNEIEQYHKRNLDEYSLFRYNAFLLS